MGTSTSYRAPQRSRWSAFVAALTSSVPMDRLRSELFNAGSEWEAELAAPAIGTFAEILVQLHGELPDRLAQVARADIALDQVVVEARHASAQTGPSAANALAERAFARLLLATVDGVADMPEAAGARWEAARGTRAELCQRTVSHSLAYGCRGGEALPPGR